MPSYYPNPDSYYLKRLFDDKLIEATLKLRAEWKVEFRALWTSIEERWKPVENTR